MITQDTIPFIIVGIIGLFLIADYVKRNWKRWYYAKDITVLEPTIKRTDLYYGYYGCLENQVQETKNHINLFMDSQFEGVERMIENIREASMDTAIDVMPQVYHKPNPNAPSVVNPDGERLLRELLQRLKDENVLKYVKIIYPSDEPNNTVNGYEEQQKGTAIVRKVAAEFEELRSVKLAAIFAGGKDHVGQDLYDYVGFDDYDMKSSALVGSEYKKMKASLLPHQKIMLVPGAAYGQDPTPFVNFAHSNPEVAIVMPFLWFDEPWGTVGKPGIRSNGLKDKYIEAGHKVTLK